MSSTMFISSAVAPVHKEAIFTSEMVTQGLMWESVNILSKQNSWCMVSMEDGYEGWVHNSYLSNPKINSQSSSIITNRCTPVRSQRGKDGHILTLLSFGTIVPILEKTSGYFRIQLMNGDDGFIPVQEEVPRGNRDIIIKYTQSLIGVPYLWGGKSSFGYDCSGFVQMLLKTTGISIPRDTGLQIKTDWLEEISFADTLPGDLIYFSEENCINHVAFIFGDGKIIHCSGEVKLESIIEGEPGFNSTLAKMDHTYTSIAKMVNP